MRQADARARPLADPASRQISVPPGSRCGYHQTRPHLERAGDRCEQQPLAGPVSEMARDQLTVIADHLSIPEDDRDWLLYPKRAIVRHLSSPHGREPDGDLHRLPGPASSGAWSSEGRDPLRARSRPQRNRRARHLDELEMRARRACPTAAARAAPPRSARALAGGAREPLPPLHAGNDSLRRPAGGRDGAGHGHQRADHGVVHGHLFHAQGDHRARRSSPANRSGPAARSAGARRPAMASPSLAFRALDALDIAPAKATAIVQGFGNVGSHAAMGLAARGVKVIGVSDHTAAFYDPRGFDVNALVAYAAKRGVLAGYSSEAAIEPARSPRAALRCACAMRGRAGDRRRSCAPPALPHHRRRRKRSDNARGRPGSRRAQRRDLRHPRYPVQRRRRDRQLFRMGCRICSNISGRATR